MVAITIGGEANVFSDNAVFWKIGICPYAAINNEYVSISFKTAHEDMASHVMRLWFLKEKKWLIVWKS